MSKEKENMFGSFGVGADARAQEQQQMEAVATGKAAPLRKRGANATTIMLTISAEDKQKLKTYAAMNCTTASDLLHKWITEFCVMG